MHPTIVGTLASAAAVCAYADFLRVQLARAQPDPRYEFGDGALSSAVSVAPSLILAASSARTISSGGAFAEGISERGLAGSWQLLQ
jgi:hypothetical protein